MARYCNNCRTEVDEYANYCPSCGAPIGAGRRNNPPPPPPRKRKSGHPVLTAIITAAVTFIVLALIEGLVRFYVF